MNEMNGRNLKDAALAAAENAAQGGMEDKNITKNAMDADEKTGENMRKNEENRGENAENRIEKTEDRIEKTENPEELEKTEIPEKVEETENPKNENAPRQAREKRSDQRKDGRKKKKPAGIALPAVALLLVIALLFGMVVGFALGRSVGAQRLRDTQEKLDALTEAFEDAAGAPVYSDFNEELTGENQSALADLSGQGFEEADVSELAGEDTLLSQMLESGGDDQQSVVVAEYAGGTIMSDEAARAYEEELAELLFSGFSEEEVSQTLMDHVLQTLVSDRILEDKAREMGFYDLTEEDQAAIDAQAESEFAEQMDFYRAFVNTEGMSEEEISGAVKNYLEQNEGVTLNGLRAELAEQWWMNKMYDAVTEDVTVDEAQLEAAYQALLEEQKQEFETDAGEFEFAQAIGEMIVYRPAGYYSVRVMTFEMDAGTMEQASELQERMAQLDARADAEKIEKCQAELDACYAAVENYAGQALEKMQAGGTFESLQSQSDVILMSSEQCVTKDSPWWDASFENGGKYSGILRGNGRVYILEYLGEVEAGEVKLADVRDALEQSVLEEARDAAFEAQMEAWLEEANAVYYPERMQ